MSFSIATMLFVACEPERSFSDIPEISNLTFEILTDSAASLTFDFTDGDGNIGLDTLNDTLPPYHIDGAFYNNLIIDYQEFENGEWKGLEGVGLSQRIMPFAPFGEIYEGQIEVLLNAPTYYNPNTTNELLRYQITLYDRDLNASNTLTSEVIPKPSI
jgi:hypothetical protein